MNKAFLLSKTHISFDTIDLSQEREVKASEVNIDPGMLDLNESVDCDEQINKFMVTRENG